MKEISKVLVANRGEIALRVMRTCREMGICTVAVYSDADKGAPFMRYADEAVNIGPPPSAQSYLVAHKIIEAAKSTGADAIHPGYGFLSENSEFAEAVEKAGIIFIGPSPKSMDTMGDKLSAKAAVKKFNIPMVPGSDGAITTVDEGKKIAAATGYPLLIKASAGGGGKGMKIVEKAEEFEEQMKRAVSEATSAFGDGSVFIEKYVTGPRHIEIQVLGDRHGNVVHLFERECSVQRRHQKVVEEAPSSVLSPELRKKMGNCAVNVAKACDYVGAGTVEFLVDEGMNFYFLEMNTRLQVEHPVTEMITGVDLVREQIRVARGEKLSFSQDDLEIRGHAMEIRVYAEDPSRGFLPDIGKLIHYQTPKGPGVRVDDGFEEGMDIPIFYDPMIAKLITYGNDRNDAIEKMKRAIREYRIVGVETTLPFCRFVMEHKAFVSGKFDTHFVSRFFRPELMDEQKEDELLVAGAMAMLLQQEIKAASSGVKTTAQPRTAWKRSR
ncbi:MAG: acetyl-CoA carboxylase biotin carboxylase subunit [Bacteroidia bacterium]|nr:acetyl-CoA carboxylase biotin carboxylase subunit [Bacteroidia bacterium]